MCILNLTRKIVFLRFKKRKIKTKATNRSLVYITKWELMFWRSKIIIIEFNDQRSYSKYFLTTNSPYCSRYRGCVEFINICNTYTHQLRRVAKESKLRIYTPGKRIAEIELGLPAPRGLLSSVFNPTRPSYRFRLYTRIAIGKRKSSKLSMLFLYSWCELTSLGWLVAK